MDNQTMNSQELQDLANLKQLHKGKGITATVFGIISLFGCLGPIALICGIVAIIVGANARKKSQKTTGTAGMVMGIIGVALSVIATIFIIAMMAGIMAPSMVNYVDKTEIASDTQLCDTVKTAITVALYDPSCADEESLDFIAYYSDGYYHDLSEIYEDDCKFAESVKEMLGYTSYEDLCADLQSDGAENILFYINGDTVAVKIPGADIEVE
ncbi:MAG: hypothetical protein IJ397_01870 [Lachnospiraceae bacterium]|nr:hypothetical protein [Lachnospiraceae bacterium]